METEKYRLPKNANLIDPMGTYNRNHPAEEEEDHLRRIPYSHFSDIFYEGDFYDT